MAKWNPRLVGIFVLGGLALATLLVTLLGGGRFFSRKVPFITYFSGSVTGLRVGAPVRFRGIVVGQVTGIYLSLEVDSMAGYVPVSFEIDEQRVRRRGASGRRLRQQSVIDSMIGRGLRAELQTESFVTGQKYVALEFRSDVPAVLVRDPAVRAMEIPAVPVGDADLQAEMVRLLRVIAKIDFQGLAARLQLVLDNVNKLFGDAKVGDMATELQHTLLSLQHTSDSIGRLAGAASSEVGPSLESLRRTSARLEESLARLDTTLQAARVSLDPESPTFVRVERAAKDISGAAQSLRLLTEYLERNPGSLLRGRPGEETR
jgi:paraquat-inducible protein B